MTYEEYKKLKDKRDLENKKQLAEIEQRRAEANKIDEERLKSIIKPIIPKETYYERPLTSEELKERLKNTPYSQATKESVLIGGNNKKTPSTVTQSYYDALGGGMYDVSPKPKIYKQKVKELNARNQINPDIPGSPLPRRTEGALNVPAKPLQATQKAKQPLNKVPTTLRAMTQEEEWNRTVREEKERLAQRPISAKIGDFYRGVQTEWFAQKELSEKKINQSRDKVEQLIREGRIGETYNPNVEAKLTTAPITSDAFDMGRKTAEIEKQVHDFTFDMLVASKTGGKSLIGQTIAWGTVSGAREYANTGDAEKSWDKAVNSAQWRLAFGTGGKFIENYGFRLLEKAPMEIKNSLSVDMAIRVGSSMIASPLATVISSDDTYKGELPEIKDLMIQSAMAGALSIYPAYKSSLHKNMVLQNQFETSSKRIEEINRDIFNTINAKNYKHTNNPDTIHLIMEEKVIINQLKRSVVRKMVGVDPKKQAELLKYVEFLEFMNKNKLENIYIPPMKLTSSLAQMKSTISPMGDYIKNTTPSPTSDANMVRPPQQTEGKLVKSQSDWTTGLNRAAKPDIETKPWDGKITEGHLKRFDQIFTEPKSPEQLVPQRQDTVQDTPQDVQEPSKIEQISDKDKVETLRNMPDTERNERVARFENYEFGEISNQAKKEYEKALRVKITDNYTKEQRQVDADNVLDKAIDEQIDQWVYTSVLSDRLVASNQAKPYEVTPYKVNSTFKDDVIQAVKIGVNKTDAKIEIKTDNDILNELKDERMKISNAITNLSFGKINEKDAKVLDTLKEKLKIIDSKLDYWNKNNTFDGWKPQQVKPEVKPEPKATDEMKIGRKGNASYKKWISNEWVNLANTPKTDTEVQSFDRFFKKWYDAGREGLRTIDVKQNTDDFNFPAFLQDEFYRAGKLDVETKPKTTGNKSTTKPKESIIEVGDNELVKEYPVGTFVYNKKKGHEWKVIGHDIKDGKEQITLKDFEDKFEFKISRYELETRFAKIKPTKEGVSDVGMDGEIKDSNTEKVPEIIPETTRAGETKGSVRDVVPSSDEGTRNDNETVKDKPTRGSKENELDRESETDRPSSEGVLGESANDIATRVIGDYRIQPGDLDIPTGEKTRYKSNVEVIKLVLQLEKEGRRATYEEQKTLTKYVGWGGIKNVFDDHNEKWKNEYKELKELLTPEQYQKANKSIVNAHYTSPEIIGAMYDIAKHLGFKHGNILEPASGVGRFTGLLPTDMQKNSSMFMVELDEITSLIAKYLYPDSVVKGIGFEKVDIPDNYFDLAISNVPFGKMNVDDSKMSRRDPYFTQSIHNYYFAKTLDKVKEGGLIIYITSTGTLDSSERKLRDYINRKAEVVSVYRLPSDTFKKTANTEVVSDIIVLRKRQKGELPSKSEIGNIVQTEFGNMNEYFQNNPKNLLGTLAPDGLYPNRIGLESKGDTVALLKERIAELPQNIFKVGKSDIKSLTVDEEIEALIDVKEGAYFTGKDGIYQKSKGKKIKVDVLVGPDEGSTDRTLKAKQTRLNNKIKRMTDLIAIKDSIKDLIVMQMKAEGEVDLKALQNKLNTLYDAFVKKTGPVTKYSKDIYEDPDSYLLNALEVVKIDEKGVETYTKSNIFTERVYKPYKRQTTAKSVDEALKIVMYEDARIDLQRIAELINSDIETVKESLAGKIFSDPKGGWELRADYLSGNVVEKLAIAKEAAELDSSLKLNVTELEKVQPVKKEYGDFKVKMGSLWVPEDVMTEILSKATESKIVSNKSLVSGNWSIQIGRGLMSEELTPYGRNASDVLTKIVNNKPITIKHKDADGNDVVDPTQTALARAKAREIAQLFDEVINDNIEIQDSLTKSYNEVNNVTVERQFEKFDKTYIGQSPALKYRPHQVQAIERGIYGGNLLLAHDVGFGKTFIMVGMAMELKRTGLAHKPMFVVPKEKLTDFRNDALFGYPQAKVLVATEVDFEKDKIKSLLGRIATNNWDMVIIAHPSLGRIPVSRQLQQDFIFNEIEELKEVLESARNDGTKAYTLSDIQVQINNLEVKLSKLDENKLDILNFEELGVDYLFVDEAHQYKNLGFATIHSGTAGVNNKHVAKTDDFYMKTKYITSLHGNKKGLIFATATPVTNALNESYTMFKYLRPDLLERSLSSAFDSWISNYGVIEEKPELKAGGIIKYTKRFRNFFNLEDFFKMFKEFADMKYDATELGLKLPKLEKGVPTRVLIGLHPEYRNWIENELLVRIANLKPRPELGDDNSLSLSDLARKATADMRLVGDYGDFQGSKVNVSANKIVEVYNRTNDYKGTQLVFFERSTSKIAGLEFDATHDLIQKLIDKGIPKVEIARFDKYNSSKQKEKLFADVNTGKIRVMIGTYAKMSTGINVQERLVALHEIDTPYRPADVLQAEGRMIRQGNLHAEWGKNVEILRYVLSDPTSYDAVMWGILETKMVAINKLMRGELKEIDYEDDSNPQAIAEKQILMIKADALGDYRIIRQTELNKEIPSIEADRNLYYKQVNKNKKIVRDNPGVILKRLSQLNSINKDIETYNSNESTKNILTINGKKFDFENDDKIIDENKKIKEEIAKIEKENKNLKKGEKKEVPKKKQTQFELAALELEIVLDKAYRNEGNTKIGEYRGISLIGQSRQAKAIIPRGETIYYYDIGSQNSFQYNVNNILALYKEIDRSGDRTQQIIKDLEQEMKNASEKLTGKEFKDEAKYQELMQEKTLIDTEIETQVPITESQTKYKKEPKDIYEKLAAKVDQTKSNQQGSLRVAKPKDTITETLTNKNLTDDQKDRIVAEEFKRSMRYGKTFKTKILEGASYVKKNVFRGAYPELERGMKHADLRAWLLRHESAKARASTRTLMNIHGLTTGMESSQYLNYAMKVVFNDLLETAKEGLALPYELEGEVQVRRLLGRVDKAITNDTLVKEAIENRRALWKALVDEFIEVHKDIGIDMSKKFERENYYRHEIIKYAIEKKTIDDVASQVKVRKDRGFLQQRKGSTENIVAQVIEADASVMTQMLYDIETAKLIKYVVESDYNIKNDLIFTAKDMNKKSLEKIYQTEAKGEVDSKGNRNSDTEKAMKEINKRIAIGFDGLKNIARSDEGLWDGDNGEYAKIVKKFANEVRSIEKDGTFNYLSKLASSDHPGNIQARTVLKNTAERTSFEKQVLGQAYAEWGNLIPEGYSKWQPEKGNVFFTSYGLADTLAQQMLEDLVKEFGVTGMDLYKHRVMGGRRSEIVIPTVVARTLDSLTPNIKKTPYREVVKVWKANTILGPRRIFRYNIRNFTGDIDSILASLSGLLHPKNHHYTVKAINDLFTVMVLNKSMTPELERWFKQGGMSSFLQAHEIGDVSQLKMFLRQTNNRDFNVVKQYFRTARLATDFREGILRYAAFMYISDQHARGNMVVGGANYKEALAITDPDMRAFWISNKTIGDYGDMSPFTKTISQTVAPFFRFTEQNIVKTFNLMNNALNYDGMQQIGGEVLKKSGYAKVKDVSRVTLTRIGRLAWVLGAFSIAATIWNKVRWGDDIEAKLSQQQRTRLYVYLWNDKDGNPIIFDRIGVISDFAEWFGLGTIASDLKEMFAGKRTLSEQAIHMVKTPLLKAVNMAFPLEKLSAELLSGYKFYPDITKPKPIRDRLQHLADSFAYKNEYDAIMGLPSKDYSETLLDLFAYRIDYKQSSYFETIQLRKKFLEKETGESIGGAYFPNAKSNALYNYKLALRLQDENAAVKYLEQYIQNGGDKKGYITSVKQLSPTYGLGANRQKFIDSLDPVEQHKFDLANQFYEEIIKNTTFVNPDWLYAQLEYKEIESEVVKTLEGLRDKKVDEIIGDRQISDSARQKIEETQTKVYTEAIELLKDDTLSLQEKEEIIKAIKTVDNRLAVESKLRSTVRNIVKDLEKKDKKK